jgi:hypothetical protein
MEIYQVCTPDCESFTTGRVKWNIDPLPTSDSTQIRPMPLHDPFYNGEAVSFL